MSYLGNKKTKEKILETLVRIMCIDISDEYTSYDIFIKDFSMFSNSILAKKAFNECIENQVE